jgi:hypothetical protein
MLIELIDDKHPSDKLIGKYVVDNQRTNKYLVTGIRPCIHYKHQCTHCVSNGVVLIAKGVAFGLCGGKWFEVKEWGVE